MNELEFIKKIHEGADATCYSGILRAWDKDDTPFSKSSWAKKEKIIALKNQGFDMQQISARLKLSITTIQHHLSDYQKMLKRKYLPETISSDMFDKMFEISDFYKICNQLISEGIEDAYFTVNSFWRKNKAGIDVRHLNCFVLDFDFYTLEKYNKYSPSEFYAKVIRERLPLPPTSVIDSGRGLYVIYCFHHCSYHMKHLYKCIYKEFLLRFQSLGMDSLATNITQVIRIPGTINTKSGNTVTVLEINDTSYKIQDFTFLLPYSTDQVKKHKQNKAKTIKVSKRKGENIYEFERLKMKTRDPIFRDLYQDFKKLIVLRNRKHNYEGYRETLLYIIREYGTWAGLSINESVQYALELNKGFHIPLTDTVVEKQCRPSKNRRKCSYETIIRKLNISIEEQQRMKLLKCRWLKKSIYAHRKRKHKLLNLTPTEIKQLNRRTEVFRLHKEGNCNKKIADKLEVDKSTITRDLQYIREHPAEFQRILLEYMKEQAMNLTDPTFLRSVVYKEQKQRSEWLKIAETALDYLVRKLGVAEN